MRRIFFLVILTSLIKNSSSQSIGIGTTTPNASSILDIRSTNKGLLIPRMTTSEVISISNPAKGLMVYDTVKNQLMINMGSTAVPDWQTIVFKSGWSLSGNSGNSASDFIGTTDNNPLHLRVNNQKAGRIDDSTVGSTFFGYQAGNTSTGMYNTGIGYLSLYTNTTGEYNIAVGGASLVGNVSGTNNIAIGTNALANNVAGSRGIAIGFGAMMFRNNSSTPFINENIAIGYESLLGFGPASLNTGNYNTAVGNQTLKNNSTGGTNTAIGYNALTANTTGSSNIGIGYRSLNSNTTGSSNVATGYSSLHNNVDGDYNTAYGTSALFQNSSGSDNTALGYYAMQSSTTGSRNTAVGSYALFSNGGATLNTAVGAEALKYNSGSNNTAMGGLVLYNNSSGINNTAMGYAAMYNNTIGQSNTGCGTYALYSTTTARYNTALGYLAGAEFNNGYNNVFVGANTEVNAAGLFNVIAMGQGTIVTSGSSTARFGNSATVSYGGWAGWSNISDGRFKKNIQENVPGLEFINKLRPVTYQIAATELDAFLHKNTTNKMSAEGMQVHIKALNEKERIIYTGFIAQEVEAIAKAMGFDFSGVDAAKNSEDTYGLRYAEFVVPLVKAVQELSKQNEGLKKQNDELLRRLESLELLLGKKPAN